MNEEGYDLGLLLMSRIWTLYKTKEISNDTVEKLMKLPMTQTEQDVCQVPAGVVMLTLPEWELVMAHVKTGCLFSGDAKLVSIHDNMCKQIHRGEKNG